MGYEMPSMADLAKQAAALQKLRAGCKKAKQAPVAFFFCPAGPDGEPVLLVGKRIKAESKKIIAKAKDKKFVRGKLTFIDGKFTFQADKPKNSKFKKLLKDRFGKEYPPLKSAVIVPFKDTSSEAEEDKVDEDTPTETRTQDTSSSTSDSSTTEPAVDWAKQMSSMELDLGGKLDIVSGAEEAIGARLATGNTTAVRKRLEKTEARIERLLRAAQAKLKELRQ